MKTILYTLAMLLIAGYGYTQQNAQYNHYIFNQLVLNPAYAGTKGVVNVNGIYSSQWSGLDGAPINQSISIEGPLFSNMGIGLHITNDQLGAQSQKGVFASYAYKLRLSQIFRLSFGISMGASYFTLNGGMLNEQYQNDPAIPAGTVTTTRFDSKFGVFLYTKKFYSGLSISDLTADVKKSAELLVAGQVKHYYLTAGYVFDLGKDFKYKPSFLIKEDFKAPTNIDLTSFFLFKNSYWLGATFRTGADIFNNKSLDKSLRTRDAIVLMTEVNITNKFRIGYAYTFSLTALKDFPGHEVMLGYYFPQKPQSRMLTPRFF
ncbi:MAG: type IX secretion system membrane protein PorP/SprF [Bacteroidia bacterium]|nr:type IX secretion system membrane protein PorP/SprF [Bacteroidia bacterium]